MTPATAILVPVLGVLGGLLLVAVVVGAQGLRPRDGESVDRGPDTAKPPARTIWR